MVDVLLAARALELPSHPALGQAILVPTDVISRPYPALSVVPDRCTVTFDRRTVPGESEEDVLEPLRQRSPRRSSCTEPPAGSIGLDRFDAYTGARGGAELRAGLVHGRDAGRPHRAFDALGAEAGHWVFCTNGSGTAALGIRTIGYGPGDETLAHRVDEHISSTSCTPGRRGTRRWRRRSRHDRAARPAPARRAGRPRPPPAGPLAFHRTLPGYAPTPLVEAPAPPRSVCGA